MPDSAGANGWLASRRGPRSTPGARPRPTTCGRIRTGTGPPRAGPLWGVRGFSHYWRSAGRPMAHQSLARVVADFDLRRISERTDGNEIRPALVSVPTRRYDTPNEGGQRLDAAGPRPHNDPSARPTPLGPSLRISRFARSFRGPGRSPPCEGDPGGRRTRCGRSGRYDPHRLEGRRVTSRFRLAMILGLAGLSGCSDSFNAGPIRYTPNPDLFSKLKNEDGTPKRELQRRVEASLAGVFGPTPQEIKVPKGSGLTDGGRLLAAYRIAPETGGKVHSLVFRKRDETGAVTKDLVSGEGGYALYRKHCLHCHGVTGDGNGPTAPFLWPRPRDYRRGMYKFTSTTGQKPTREDLRQRPQPRDRQQLDAVVRGADEPSRRSSRSSEYVIFLSPPAARPSGGWSTRPPPRTSRRTRRPSPPSTRTRPKRSPQGVFDAWNHGRDRGPEPADPPHALRPPSIHRRTARSCSWGWARRSSNAPAATALKPRGTGRASCPTRCSARSSSAATPPMHDAPTRRVPGIDREGERAVEDALERELGKGRVVSGDREKKAVGSPQEGQDRFPEARPGSKGSLDDWGNPLRPANINNGPSHPV